MPQFTFAVYDQSSFTTPIPQEVGGAQSADSVTTAATLNPIFITVEDTISDARFSEVDNSTDGFNGNQVLVNDVVINGVLYPAGTFVSPQYSIDLPIAGAEKLMGISFTASTTSAGISDDDNDAVQAIAFSPQLFGPFELSPSTVYTGIGIDAADSLASEAVYTDLIAGSPPPPPPPPVCFINGTKIKTLDGEMCIETLAPGAMVFTMDKGYQPLRWIGSRKISQAELRANPKLRPIRIKAGALGDGLPEQDLLVSRQHRVLVRSKVAIRMFDTAEVLIPAVKLVALDGIDVAEDVTEVEYLHILFDEHHIVFSNGAPTESLFTGPEALKAVSPEARAEIAALFPEVLDPNFKPAPARPIPEKGKHMNALAERLYKNNKDAFDQTLYVQDAVDMVPAE